MPSAARTRSAEVDSRAILGPEATPPPGRLGAPRLSSIALSGERNLPHRQKYRSGK